MRLLSEFLVTLLDLCGAVHPCTRAMLTFSAPFHFKRNSLFLVGVRLNLLPPIRHVLATPTCCSLLATLP